MIIRNLNKLDIRELSQVFEIQIKAYKVEARLLNVESLPPLEESIRSLEITSDVVFLAIKKECIVGAIFLEKSDPALVISKLIVHPAHFRKGVAKRLIEYSLNQFSKIEFQVSTAQKNFQLYVYMKLLVFLR
jgi:hypothetical protein